MRRRALLTGTAAALLASGCSRSSVRPTTPVAGGASAAGGATATGAPPSSAPTGAAVASWRLVGGFIAPGYVAVRAPRLSVYATGLAVADATYQGQLAPAEVASLVDQLTKLLADGTAGHRRPGAPMVMDAPATEIVVRGDGHTYTVTADGVDELRSRKAYPDQLYQARDLLDAVYQKAVKGGRRYTSGRVRLVATPVRGSAPPSVAPWPAGVPVPGGAGTAGALTEDLGGTQAARALAGFPLAAPTPAQWRTYAVPGGGQLSGAVRYLLPDE